MIAWVLCLQLVAVAGATCLPDAIPAENRKNLTNPATGQSYPLGMWIGGCWAVFWTFSFCGN
jgi:hypothetical protein